MNKPLALVYLARRRSGLEAFVSFVDAYKRHNAGIEHDLIIVFKGFTKDSLRYWRTAAEDLTFSELHLLDFGYDTYAYRQAVERLEYSYYCLLNSFSRPLCKDWLAALDEYKHTSVGAVGCTGAWTSIYSVSLHQFETKPTLIGLLRLYHNLRAFQPFPNPHLRTNAFLVSRDTMLRLWPRYALRKRDAHKWESGRHGFTQHLIAEGRAPLIVSRSGQAFTLDEWFRANTFNENVQEQLLVADNQTDKYVESPKVHRSLLSYYAWGKDFSKT